MGDGVHDTQHFEDVSSLLWANRPLKCLEPAVLALEVHFAESAASYYGIEKMYKALLAEMAGSLDSISFLIPNTQTDS